MGRNSTNNDNSAVGAEFASVVSPNGFSTGDLVYRSSSGYGVMPSGAVSSGSVPLSPSPTYSNVVERSASVATLYDTGGGWQDTCAAKLTNGNIVVVYVRNNYTVYFKIFDVNNNTVVAETQVDSNMVGSSQCSSASVAALTGGGFVVWGYRSGTGLLVYRGFDNSGVASYALTSSTITPPGFGPVTCFLRLYPRPDGRVLVVTINNTSNAVYAVYNANGTNYVAATTFGSGTSPDSNSTGAVVFADSSFLLFIRRQSQNTFEWYRRSEAGAAVANNSFTVADNSLDVKLLNNGNAAIYYTNGSSFLCFRSFTTASNTVGSEVVLLSVAITSNYAPLSAYTITGTNNNIVFFTSTSAVLWGPREALMYLVTDGTTGSVIAGGSNPLTVIGMANFTQPNSLTFIDVGSNVRAYMRAFGNAINTLPGSVPGSTNYFEINTSTYTPVVYSSYNRSYGTVTGIPTGAYQKSSSLPASAYFLASASSNPTASAASMGSVLLNQTVVASETTYSMRLLQLSTGNILVAWHTAGGVVRFKVYDSSFAAVTTVTVDTGTSMTAGGVVAFEFPDGKIGIAYQYSTTSTLVYKVYSSAFVEIQARVTITTGVSGNVFDICALRSSVNTIVAVFKDTSNFYTVSIRDQSGTSLFSTNSGSGTVYAVNVVPVANGNFVVGYQRNSVLAQRTWYKTSSLTSWTQGSEWVLEPGIASDLASGTKFMDISPQGTIAMVSPAGAATYLTVSSSYGTSTNTSLNTGIQAGSSLNFVGLAVNEEGYAAVLYAPNTAANPAEFWTWQTSQTGVAVASQPGSSVFSSQRASNNRGCTVCPFYGNYFVLGMLNTSQYPTIAVVAGYDRSYPVSISSGTTTVGPVTIDPSTGFSLIGVAASDCAAGGAGQVQTKGTAVLSSSYPTTTQTFDFTNPVTYGVKGTVSNRVITLED